MFAKNCQELISLDKGGTALRTGICKILNTSVHVDQICIFQEWHFNGIKTEIKEIYVYSLVSVTDCDLLLKYNILPVARFLSAIEYKEWKVISNQP